MRVLQQPAFSPAQMFLMRKHVCMKSGQVTATVEKEWLFSIIAKVFLNFLLTFLEKCV